MKILLTHAGAWNVEDITVRGVEQRGADAGAAAAVGHEGLMDAVEAAIRVLEDDPALDAGTGSILQMDGRARMDAGLCTSEGEYGGVLQIEEVRYPISVARKILEFGYHTLLSGEGAKLFAIENGFSRHSPITEAMVTAHLKQRELIPELSYKALADRNHELHIKKLSTVGAVAVDTETKRLVAGCSTGGLDFGYPGRVGDTALLGHGVYASPLVAVACTGHGEAAQKTMLAKRVEEGFLRHGDLVKACDEALDMLARWGQGGIIAVAVDGQSAIRHSTTFMGAGKVEWS